MRAIIPQTFGGPHDNYYNRVVDWIHSSKFRSLVRQTKPRWIMEIGILHGKSTKMMINEARKAGVKEIEYYGFDLFEKAPKYEEDDPNDSANKMEEINNLLLNLNVKYHLFKGNTRETLPKAVSTLPKMDFIYIDGGHSYETAKSDWENCKKLMHSKTVVVFDDYEVIDGVTRVVDEISSDYDVGSFTYQASVGKRKRAVVRRLS